MNIKQQTYVANCLILVLYIWNHEGHMTPCMWYESKMVIVELLISFQGTFTPGFKFHSSSGINSFII